MKSDKSVETEDVTIRIWKEMKAVIKVTVVRAGTITNGMVRMTTKLARLGNANTAIVEKDMIQIVMTAVKKGVIEDDMIQVVKAMALKRETVKKVETKGAMIQIRKVDAVVVENMNTGDTKDGMIQMTTKVTTAGGAKAERNARTDAMIPMTIPIPARIRTRKRNTNNNNTKGRKKCHPDMPPDCKLPTNLPKRKKNCENDKKKNWHNTLEIMAVVGTERQCIEMPPLVKSA